MTLREFMYLPPVTWVGHALNAVFIGIVFSLFYDHIDAAHIGRYFYLLRELEQLVVRGKWRGKTPFTAFDSFMDVAAPWASTALFIKFWPW